ncbi:putative reverse transcriptase domain-containing protein [Tanacetum coccineum]
MSNAGQPETTVDEYLAKEELGGINKALADLGASISLMPYSMFLRLNLGELKPTRMCIELANRSTQIPRGIAENIFVKIDKFVFPVDFVVLDMKEDRKMPIILGRPFLATAHAMIDVFNKKISFEVGGKTITFNIEKSMRFPPSVDDTCYSVDMINLSILDHVQEILPSEPFDSFFLEPINHHLPTKINSLWDDNEGEHDLINQISGDPKPESEDYTKPTLFAENMFEGEKPTTKLKDLPSYLEYAFLGNNQEFLVIISSLLSTQEKELLLEVLAKHNGDGGAWRDKGGGGGDVVVMVVFGGGGSRSGDGDEGGEGDVGGGWCCWIGGGLVMGGGWWSMAGGRKMAGWLKAAPEIEDRGRMGARRGMRCGCGGCDDEVEMNEDGEGDVGCGDDVGGFVV